MATHLPPNWQDRVVVGVNATPTYETKRFLTAQAIAEGGQAKWNPCNTTLWLPGFTDLPNYNDVGVRNYTYPNAGVAAHVLTLTIHEIDGTLRYGRIVNELQHAADGIRTAEQMVRASWMDLQRWGTNPDLMLDVLVRI